MAYLKFLTSTEFVKFLKINELLDFLTSTAFLNFLTTLAPISVLVVAFLALRNDKITLVRQVLRTKADEVNAYLNKLGPSELDKDLSVQRIADILRVISCTDFLLGIYIATNKIPFIALPTDVLLNEFYLQLHSKVRDWLKAETPPKNSPDHEEVASLFKDCKYFLADQISKDKENVFSSHKFSNRFKSHLSKIN